MRFYEWTTGAILVDGADIRSYSRKNLRDMFGMVLQDTWLFEAPSGKNIVYSKASAMQRFRLPAKPWD